MNNPNPFVPKGSILEQQSKRRSRLKIAVFCTLAVGVAGLSALLIDGCKREAPQENADDTTTKIDTNTTALLDTNMLAPGTNVQIGVLPPIATNLPPIQPPAEQAESVYTILKGDTLDKIAKAHHVSVNALKLANPKVQPTRLKIGDKITIPAPAVSPTTSTTSTTVDSSANAYKVKSGDNLGNIAKHFGVTIKAIQAENGLSTTVIKVGQTLKIPAKTAAAAPAPTAPEPLAPVAPIITPVPVTPPAH